MAKKRGGSGSNLGLIITLVFFVLSTVILGVTTYIGYSGQEEKDKAKDKAEKEAKQFDADSKWYRFLYRVSRMYQGAPPPGLDAADLTREKQQFDGGQLIYASNQKDKDEATKWLQATNARMPWQNNAPATTYEQRLEAQARLVDSLRADISKAQTALALAKKEAEDEKKKLEEEIANRQKALDANRALAAKERGEDKADIAKRISAIQVDANTLVKLRQDVDEAKRETDKMSKSLAKEKADRLKLNDERNDFKRRLDDANRKLELVVARTGVDLREIEAKELTATAKEKLDRWNRSWQIVDIDRKGSMPYINLGTSDRVVPQLTFSVHEMKVDGRLNPTPKATVEVVRVIGPHLSQARITSTNDSRKDPVLKGDRLFHPTWDPERKKFIAIAGVVDLDGDGTDGTARFRRLLEKQNIEVDAYIDVADEKAPRLWQRLKDRPITIDTEYLVLGYGLNNIKHPKAKDADYLRQYETLMKQLRTTATDNAVKIIRLADYLEMMGYSSGRGRAGSVGRIGFSSYGR